MVSEDLTNGLGARGEIVHGGSATRLAADPLLGVQRVQRLPVRVAHLGGEACEWFSEWGRGAHESCMELLS